MPKHKTLIVFAVVIAFSFSLIGCGFLNFGNAGPEDITGAGDDLPEWLLLAHRSTEGPGTERDDDLLEADDENDTDADNGLAVGGSDQDDGITAPSADQGTTQTAQAPQSSQPSSSQDSGTTVDAADPEPEFGTKEHLIWLKEQQENAKTVGQREAEKAAAEAAEDDSGWWGGSFGGSGPSWTLD